jgi:hypothetical protein
VAGAGAAVRTGRRRRGSAASLRAYAWTIAAAGVLGLLVAAGPVWWRLLCATSVAALLVAISFRRPVAGIAATLVYLVFMALLRRLFIAEAGWSSADPMLLVGPFVALVLLAKLYVIERRRLAPDLLSGLVLAVLGLTLLEAANPAGGLAAGIAGLLFTAVPLLWFFVGRGVLDGRSVDRVLGLLVVLGIAVALYGLMQTQIGEPPWDVNWVNVNGYSSLHIGDTVRAFGTFSSAAEYALWVGSALAVAVAFVLRGRPLALLPIPILAVALFLSSNRGALVTTAFAVVALIALRTKRPLTALAITVCALALAFGGLRYFSSGLTSAGSGSSSALVSHQLGGIAEPLNPNSSTLLVHLQLAWEGIKSSIHHPLGEGTSATNGASGVNPSSALNQTQATEVDISNAFVDLGVAGGVLYLAVVVLTLYAAVRSYFAGADAMLAVIGVLIVGLGQWLTGGNYALSSLTWLLIGAVAATSASALATRRSRGR